MTWTYRHCNLSESCKLHQLYSHNWCSIYHLLHLLQHIIFVNTTLYLGLLLFLAVCHQTLFPFKTSFVPFFPLFFPFWSVMPKLFFIMSIIVSDLSTSLDYNQNNFFLLSSAVLKS